MDELAFAKRMLALEQLSLVGAPTRPPPDLPDIFEPSAVESSVDRIAGACEVPPDSLMVDCSEFPCIVYEFFSSDPTHDEHNVFSCPTQPWPWTGSSMSGISRTASGFVEYATVEPDGWADPDEIANLQKRNRYRIDADLEKIP